MLSLTVKIFDNDPIVGPVSSGTSTMWCGNKTERQTEWLQAVLCRQSEFWLRNTSSARLRQ